MTGDISPAKLSGEIVPGQTGEFRCFPKGEKVLLIEGHRQFATQT